MSYTGEFGLTRVCFCVLVCVCVFLCVCPDAKRQPRSEQDGESQGSSGGEGVPSPPSRLVPGHRLWASRGGRHVLGLTEDHSALRRHIAQARRLARSMDTLQQQGQENRVNTHTHTSVVGCLQKVKVC